ncbi:nucleotidyltransferase domain-containing protein [Tissierella carlieri]|uniref:nucleotidyltransferase domain-containing protein n=1 Tax=Tissierella carlieri TaxID=689904 RepID=UPI001C119C43|nr:nucleotidyltransferase domain-containing protein [Tissierella carlieri]MBU5313824.1 nucleotidyltransferase domain-containing protein [Tissierella carlieri]
MKENIFNDKSFIAMINNLIDRVKAILDDNLLSIIIVGSVALGDYIYGKGDIDFLVVTERDLLSNNCKEIINLHDRLRAGEFGQFGIQLEGMYCPLPMLKEPEEYIGLGYYIGTGRNGWKKISTSVMSKVDHLTLSKYGKIVYGKDINEQIFRPSYDELKKEILKEIESNIKYSKDIEDIYFSLHLLYLGTRSLYTFINNDILSKGKSCDWFMKGFPDSSWIPFIKYTSQYRYPFDEIEKKQVNEDYIIKNAPLFLEHIYSMIKDKEYI